MTVRAVLAAVLAGAALAAPAAHADPDPPCKLYWEPWIEGHGPVFEHVSVDRPYWVC